MGRSALQKGLHRFSFKVVMCECIYVCFRESLGVCVNTYWHTSEYVAKQMLVGEGGVGGGGGR